ncbi:MAG: AmmeMemoRadiSam system protein B [Deltaproteobacteria bacterium RBG_16_66_15]|nr:MAG: AmmeMemoRadiSam system protein B [Deltaproteobacteria bacterium GWA2_65_63]OGP29087.1 MAG: AmmeMemoRadiSam system protein B [Deltaproteobacteria bacterium GWB2_65_81]OGP38275.1 MAG: AmmeMemoRadiSam system protein B [Deltaproteobacteria bacterium GWC2_66_88]OGP79648.1 MAG: AmmeMemoRadiSam system protein B [Deltaproteobacteria bacterium RBG_16_66_15]HAM32013.1 AmmeMemoRadiSam system protein B [Deltaproteobacteria bacterium]
MKRMPAVAGQFYPGTASGLSRALLTLTREVKERVAAIGVVSPHAGYVYSGAVAGEVFSSIHVPERSILFCPNHTGAGEDAAVMSHGTWLMPWGEVPIDEELAAKLENACPLLREDPSAHAREHSIEVQIPFLHRFRPDIRFVPVALGRLSLEECRELGESVADAVSGDAERPLLVASSDMSHYVPDAVARKKDRMAIDRMLALDPEGLYRTVRTERISMCGVLPATVVLYAALRLGATSARLIRYATSGDVSREFDQVVGYAGLAFF